MVIILTAQAAVDEKYVAHPAKRIMKWENDHDFGFNIGVPALWYFYLQEFTVNGQRLPLVTKKGTPVVYKVMRFGGYPPLIVMFPGHANDGTKLYSAKYGRIDQHREFWEDQLNGAKDDTM
jgi:hypothetical protein